ncbi:uncharacterized protein EI90DRAFT_3143557 [Cantharellus anzutake]|uniref:uncharacterized protein n=1 Tax=Cantharellus anzutake TaxID=1750568 RepID=UPI001903B56D|nr:uncharacterized protein EI90DRAFT_3143557 [Cantharellus anzutake]KAF8343169.1 hypothetical protein EI90DRAFT_3143557 [Cantharellus anzutake]
MTTVTCLHAAVAQKSYGHEKRFLCPPPLVRIDSPIRSISEQRLTMSVVTEDGARLAEQSSTIDEQLQFKYLHVGGASTKSKSFHLSLEISGPIPAPSHEPSSAVPALRTWASFESAPVTIISKPSKKTAKTRNVSTCIMDGSSISLFNRINSQTVRTKYMTVDRAELAASNASWSAFRVQILDDEHGNPIDPSQSLAGASRNGPPPQRPIHYGSRIVLTDEATGISSEPLIVRKVDKGKLSRSDTGGLVSQMQKVALQRASTNSDMPSPTGLFLSAGRLPLPVHAADRSSISMSTSHATPDGKAIASAHPLTYQAPRSTGNAGGVDEVDDFLCWTVVGIAEYHYTFFDASTTHPPSIVPHRPITPFPVSANVPALPPSVNRLELDVFNFYSPDPITGAPIPMEVWIGTVGPLTVRIQPASTPPYNAQFDMTGHSLGPVDSHAGPSLSHGQDPGATPNLAMHRVPPNLTSISVDLPTPQDVLNAIMQRDADGLTIPGPTRARGSGSPSSSSPAPSGSRPAPGTHSASFPVRESDAMPFSPALSGRSLPIFFVRPYDRVGYMSGYSLACESIYAGPLPHGTGAEASQPAAWGFRVI